MWQKPVFIFILFYFFALLQKSLLAYINFLGTIPNIVFIFFFTLLFFSSKPYYHKIIFLSLLAGIILDIYYYNYIGPSVLFLLVVGFLFKKVQSLLVATAKKFPLNYFIYLFIASLAVYYLFTIIYVNFFEVSKFVFSLKDVLLYFVCNLVTALLFYYSYIKIYKIFNGKNI